MSNSNVSGWLPNLLGITTVQSDGTDVTARRKLNFVGATVTSNAGTDAIDVELADPVPPTGTGFRHVTSGTEDAAAKLVVNADVDAAAAIAGSKVSPDFGAQNIVTTGYISIGASPASSGDVRLPALGKVYAGTLPLVSNLSSTFVAVGGSGVTGVYLSVGGSYPLYCTSGNTTINGTVTSDDTYGGGKSQVTSTRPVTVTTTDATVTTLDSFTLATDTTVVVTYVVTAIKDDETQAATYVRTACFRNDSGTVSQVGSTQDGGTFEDDAAWDCTIDNSTTTIRCRVTGKAATNIRWACVSERLKVAY